MIIQFFHVSIIKSSVGWVYIEWKPVAIYEMRSNIATSPHSNCVPFSWWHRLTPLRTLPKVSITIRRTESITRCGTAGMENSLIRLLRTSSRPPPISHHLRAFSTTKKRKMITWSTKIIMTTMRTSRSTRPSSPANKIIDCELERNRRRGKSVPTSKCRALHPIAQLRTPPCH